MKMESGYFVPMLLLMLPAFLIILLIFEEQRKMSNTHVIYSYTAPGWRVLRIYPVWIALFMAVLIPPPLSPKVKAVVFAVSLLLMSLTKVRVNITSRGIGYGGIGIWGVLPVGAD